MSRVTNLIITFSSLEDVDIIIENMRRYKTNADSFHIVSVEDKALPTRWYGGSKSLECTVLIGAYNYLDLNEFLTFLRSEVEWEAPDLVQLFVKEQDEFKFKLIELVQSDDLE